MLFSYGSVEKSFSERSGKPSARFLERKSLTKRIMIPAQINFPGRALSRPSKVLLGPGRANIPTVGQFMATLQWNERSCQGQVYLVDNLRNAVMGSAVIRSLQVWGSLLEVSESTDILNRYQKLTSGVGVLNAEYKITLLPDAKPYAVTYPRRVPLPMLPSVQREL